MPATTIDGKKVQLDLYTFEGCPYCRRVLTAISRLGVDVTLHDIVKDEKAAKRLVEVGGEDQVPCLFIDGKPLYESADIVAYLEKSFAKTAAKGAKG